MGAIDVEAAHGVDFPAREVGLAQIKRDPALKDMALLRQSRLSVMPVTKPEFDRILELGTKGDG